MKEKLINKTISKFEENYIHDELLGEMYYILITFTDNTQLRIGSKTQNVIILTN